MTKSVEQINRELTDLEQQAQTLAGELQSLYDDYLDELGKTAYQRMISVCYQLCTQAFPDLFLKLSMSDRDRLQRSIKEESQSLQQQLDLVSLLKASDESSRLEAALLKEVQNVGSQRSNQDSLMEDLAMLNLSEAGPAELMELLSSDDVQRSGSSPSSESPREGTVVERAESESSGNREEHRDGADSEENSVQHTAEKSAEESAAVQADDPELRQDPSTLEEQAQPEVDSVPPAELPITIIHAGDGPLSPGMIASAIAAEADDENAQSGPNAQPLLLGMGRAEPAAEVQADPRTPAELKAWHERLERRISQRLRRSSQAMTRLLEKSGVLNNQLPDGLLAAVPESSEPDPGSSSRREQGRGEMRRDEMRRDEMRRGEPSHPRDEMNLQAPGSPHILNLTLESADGSKKKRKGTRIQIVAIYLRLAELEFEAPMLMGRRNQIRSQLKQLHKLERRYGQKERERAIAEAEAAWRSTWSNQ